MATEAQQTVNGQVPDSVSQANVVLGAAPANALGSLLESASHITGVSVYNGVTNQQLANITHQASTQMGNTIIVLRNIKIKEDLEQCPLLARKAKTKGVVTEVTDTTEEDALIGETALIGGPEEEVGIETPLEETVE